MHELTPNATVNIHSTVPSVNARVSSLLPRGPSTATSNPIQANTIKEVCEKRLGLDTRVTTPRAYPAGRSALRLRSDSGRSILLAACGSFVYDALQATLQGVEAVEAVLVASPEKPAPVIGLRENMITREPLMDAVKKTQSVAEAIANKDFGKAMSLRDPEFEEGFIAFNAISRIDSDLQLPEKQRMRIGIIQ